MNTILTIALAVSALYCICMWLFLAATSIRNRVDVETETFHLGLCFIIAVGFLYLGH